MYLLFSEIVKVMVIYKRTLCRSVRFVVTFVVDKLDSRCAVVQFCQSFVNHTQNWTPLSPITIINRVFSFFQWWLLTILCIPPRKRVISRGRLLFMTRWTRMRRGRQDSLLVCAINSSRFSSSQWADILRDISYETTKFCNSSQTTVCV